MKRKGNEPMKALRSYHMYAMIAIVGWSFAYVITRLSIPYFTPLPFGFMRYFVAALALIVVAIIKKMKLPAAKDWPWLVASGLCGYALYIACFNIGTSYVSAATSSVVIATCPVMTALLAAIVYGEKLKGTQWLAIAIEFVGIAVLTLLDDVFTANIHLSWLFAAAILLSLYNLIQRKLSKTYSALESTCISIWVGVLFLSVFAPPGFREAAQAPRSILVYIALIGIFSTAIAFLSWSKAFALAKKTSFVSNYMFITPLLTSILGFIMAGEIPGRATVMGGIIILLGAVVFINPFAKQMPAQTTIERSTIRK